MSQREGIKMMIRVPVDVKRYLEEQATRNASTQSSEAVRSIRARMDSEHRAAG
jgi:hypothetical protein